MMSLRLLVFLPTLNVVLCLPLLDFRAPGIPQTVTECMCFLCGAQRFVSQIEKAFTTSVAYKSHRKKDNTSCNRKSGVPW